MLRSRKNQYFGVNAHLHSYLQSNEGWTGFHGKSIADLAEIIKRLLPPGYLVDTERSLQIRDVNRETREITKWNNLDAWDELIENIDVSDEPNVRTQPLIETLDLDEDQYHIALMIYKLDDDQVIGHPITRIELLTPSNKRGIGYLQYREKRSLVLKAGIHMVEIDYLHETRPIVRGLPRYPYNTDSHAYHIIVSNPTPSLRLGTVMLYGFDVDQRIPKVMIPLLGEDRLGIDFGMAYHQTYQSLKAYSQRVNYGQLPENFNRYSPADQTRIWRRMAVIEKMAERSIDLETGPFLRET